MSPSTTQPNGQTDREIVAETFDKVVSDYNERIGVSLGFSGVEHRVFVDGKARLVRELARAHIADPSKAAALDLGCGIGNYDADLSEFFGDLSGVDVSVESIAFAKLHHPKVGYVHYEGGRLPFEDEKFELVFAICVMHHVPPADWLGFAAEINRVLKPGGLALIFEHNPLNPATQYIVRSCDIDRDAVLLWPARARSIFRQCGFDTIRTRTIFSLPPILPVLRLVDGILGLLPFGAQYYLSAVKQGTVQGEAA